jgi:hypothetical protein
MKWPRGKYNGQRIIGFNIRIIVDLTDWRLIPDWYWELGTIHAYLLCVFMVMYPEYEHAVFDKRKQAA